MQQPDFGDTVALDWSVSVGVGGGVLVLDELELERQINTVL